MRRIFLYAHGGSGNHGCEAIVRATAKILKNEELCLISSKPEEDLRYGLGEICEIIKDTSASINKKSLDFWKAYAALKLKKDFVPMDKLWCKDAFSHIRKGDIALSIGGDNYCYADFNKYIMLHDMLKKRGAKTVLWGCSVEPELLADEAIARDLARYDLITARESISYEALKAVNPNTVLVSDPAFVLDRVDLPLPDGWVDGKMIGINASPLILDCGNGALILEAYRRLFETILEKTDCSIALIPHVVEPGNDDRTVLMKFLEEYRHTNRIVMLEDCNCMELKGYIARCRFFIGARTHATIAAYSSCVPTLVAGYSVKSRGIARDIFGTEEGYVIPVQNLESQQDLADAFYRLWQKENEIRTYLQKKMPDYKNKAYTAGELLRLL